MVELTNQQVRDIIAKNIAIHLEPNSYVNLLFTNTLTANPLQTIPANK